MIKKFNLLFVTLFNVGKIKYLPGSFASLLTCFLFFLLNNIFDTKILIFLTLLIFLYSFLAINTSFDSFDSNDPKEIVIDEVVGQMIPLLAIPIYETLYPTIQIYYFIISFLFFRLFDIWKPFPIDYVDNNTKGALGIMLDDIIAGVYTIIFISIIFFFLGG